MSENVSKSMTMPQVKDASQKFRAHVEDARIIYLELFEAEAHKIAGYSSWPEFCKDMLGLDYGKTYHSDMLRVARVERNVLASAPATEEPKSSDISELAELKPVKKLPIQTVLKKVAPLPISEQPKAYEEEVKAVAAKKFNTKNSGSSRVDEMRRQREEALLRPAQPTPTISHSAPQVFRQPVLARPMPKMNNGEPVELEFVEVSIEGKFVRIDVTMPDGTPAFVTVPKRSLPGGTTEHQARDEYAQ